MRILVIGGGGREHALCWSLRRSPRVTGLLCAPGNAGIATIATCLPVDQTSVPDMLRVTAETSPDLVVIGPEVPLAAGIVDALQQRGIRVFGPTRAAARLESSKAFSKAFMQRHGIPTARYEPCSTLDEVRAALPRFSTPIVVKADGLAAGKGVIIASTIEEAQQAATDLLQLGGTPGGTIVIEEFLEGEELSFFALCDGTTAVPIAAAQDHKRLLDNDRGPNTGGMGAYSTNALLPDTLRDQLLRDVAQRTVDGMRAEGTPFHGILFCGIMLTPSRGPMAPSPMVLEFNTRWGDPETEAIVLRLQTGMLDLIDASIDGTAAHLHIQLSPEPAACVIAASAGYPAAPRKGDTIHGLNTPFPPDTQIFHSGTALSDGNIVTAGGRVLAISSIAPTLQDALNHCYAALGNIRFNGMQFRSDVGARALR